MAKNFIHEKDHNEGCVIIVKVLLSESPSSTENLTFNFFKYSGWCIYGLRIVHTITSSFKSGTLKK